MALEQERQHEEEEAAARRAASEATARREAELKARAEEEARLHAEDERRRAEEARRREEAARHEALRVAELERARIEAENRARIALIEQQQKHERELAAIESDSQKKRLKRVLWGGVAAAVLVFGGGAGLYFGQIKPDLDHRRAVEQQEMAQREAELKRLQDEFDKARAREQEALNGLAAARDEAARVKATQALADTRKATEDARKRLAGAPPAAAKKKAETNCKCADPNDPMCGCLP